MKSLTIFATQRNRILLWMSTLLMAIATVDALVAATWDLVLVLGLALIVQLIILLTLRGRRPVVPLRDDLYRWLEERSATTGEPFEFIADRCVAAYRAGLSRDATVVKDRQ